MDNITPVEPIQALKRAMQTLCDNVKRRQGAEQVREGIQRALHDLQAVHMALHSAGTGCPECGWIRGHDYGCPRDPLNPAVMADRARLGSAVAVPTDEQIIAIWNAWPRQGITSRARAVEFVRVVLAATPPAAQVGTSGASAEVGRLTVEQVAALKMVLHHYGNDSRTQCLHALLATLSYPAQKVGTEDAVASLRIKTWPTGQEHGLEGLAAITKLPDGAYLLYTAPQPPEAMAPVKTSGVHDFADQPSVEESLAAIVADQQSRAAPVKVALTEVGTVMVRIKDGFPRKAPELFERYQALVPGTILYADLSADVGGITTPAGKAAKGEQS